MTKILKINEFINESAGAPMRMRTPDRFNSDKLKNKQPNSVLNKQHTKYIDEIIVDLDISAEEPWCVNEAVNALPFNYKLTDDPSGNLKLEVFIDNEFQELWIGEDYLNIEESSESLTNSQYHALELMGLEYVGLGGDPYDGVNNHVFHIIDYDNLLDWIYNQVKCPKNVKKTFMQTPDYNFIKIVLDDTNGVEINSSNVNYIKTTFENIIQNIVDSVYNELARIFR